MHSSKEPEIKKETKLTSSGRTTAAWNFNETFEAAEGTAARKRLCYNDYIIMLSHILYKVREKRQR